MIKFFQNNIKTSLLNRMLKLVLIPLFIVQFSSIYIFYQRYWEKLSKKNILTIVKDIDAINKYFNKAVNKINILESISNLNNLSSFEIEFKNNEKIKEDNLIKTKTKESNFFLFPIQVLNNYLTNFNEKISLYRNQNYDYVIEIEKIGELNGLLSFGINKKLIFISNLDLIIFWNLLCFVLISVIIIFFIINQVKSIKTLKNFINDFSYLEKENASFKPTGAKEIREMGMAFINMVRKTKYFLNSRTIMLAQISHDLRTPLTRIKLQAEFIEDEEIKVLLKKDLTEMEKIINEYILFAKGETTFEVKEINIKKFFLNIINDYTISDYKDIKISFNLKTEKCFIKDESFKRAINNLINNALKYRKKQILITIITNLNNLIIKIEDDGEGIDKNLFNKVKKPFAKLHNKNNTEIPSNGLGLSIVNQIILSHKGKVEFDKSKLLGGLLVNLIIPLNKEKNENENKTNDKK